MIISGFKKLQPWKRTGLVLGALLLLGAPTGLCAANRPLPMVPSPGSIKEIPAAQAVGTGSNQAQIVRKTLTADEAAAPMQVEVALQMRNFAELQARLARGEIIPREEMAVKYFPLAADYEATAAWLTAQGLTVVRDDTMRLSLFARGTISQLREAFQVDFARVTYKGAEYTSAVTAPCLPAALAPSLVGVNGLQPHLRVNKMATRRQAQPASLSTPNAAPYLPAEILKAYGANATGLTGAGQTIAIVMDVFPISSDLTAFWSQCNVPQSINNIVPIQVANIPAALTPTNPNYDGTEVTIDVELTSSIAPGATIRVYVGGDLEPQYLDQAYSQIYNDLKSQPQLHVVNLSYGICESEMPRSSVMTDQFYFSALASSGVTVFASSGDGGSNPDLITQDYNAKAAAQVMHPASDPSVTGVGATTLILNLSTGLESSETGFSLEQVMGGESASGGGISALFSRPSWQTGTGVPSGMMRLVPDLAATGDPADGCYIFYDGSGATPYGGTSVSAPIWSGFCALLNQALANASLPPVGLLGPKIYPLIGTTSLRDITSGNNGLYSAGVGYDMVTGVGVPNVGALALSLGAQGSAPQITAQPASMTAMPGQNASFSVTASGFPSAAYQWQVQATGTTTWSNLSDNGTYSGSATATLTVSSATTALSGNLYQCVVSNSLGTVTSAPAALVVVYPLSLTTLAGLAGTSGSADGTGSAARFYDPCDVAADSAGNVFVADTNNSTIRKITPAGAVTTLAGLAGTSGSSDGTGSAARFNSPAGLAVDGSDNVYVADTHNNTIRKISPTGVVTTVAGLAGSGGSSDGTGTARFNSPAGLTVDGSGNVYVADTHNNTIRKITPTGVVSTVAGLAGTGGSSNGTGSAALFSSPEGVTVDGSGNLYVADTGNHTIRKITPAGAVTTLAGLAGISGSSDGAGSMARFQYPAGLTVTSAGNLYVADTDNNTIRQISPAGLVATIAGLAGFSGSTDGVGSAARLFYPDGVAVDGSGNVYVADTDNHTIREGQVVSAPQILTQPQSETVTVGTNVTFSVTATGVPAPTYQWNNSGAAISGATASTLTLNNVQTGSAGTYTVVVTNLLGSVTSNPATLTVNAAAATTSTPSSGGGGGGGGAPSLWFYGAFSLLVALRRAFRRK